MTDQTTFIQSLEVYRLIIDTTSEGVWIIDAQNKTSFVNHKMAELLGYKQEEMIGKTLFDFMDEEGATLTKHNLERGKNGIAETHEFRFKTFQGDDLWSQINLSPIFENGTYKGALAMVCDISCKKLEEKQAEEKAKIFTSLFDDSPTPIWDEDFSKIKHYLDELKAKGVKDVRAYFEEDVSRVIECSSLMIVNNLNQAVVELNEADSKEHMMNNYRDLLNADSTEYAIRQFEAIFNGDKSCEFDAELRTFGGNKRHVHLKWTVVRGFEETYGRVYLTTTDVTKRIMAENALLKNSNREKELLLKEIHHRVKNNLQIITSLLKLQTNSIEDQATIDLFEMSLHRINSMAIVHELLYQSKDFSQINYGQYINKLVHPLIESLKNPYSKINLHIDIKDDVSLNINTSIPLGLLINEIITNSLKHGLKEAERGAIYLKIINKGNDKYLMTIGDNGTGFAPNFELENATSLGLQLVTSLAEQLSGTIHRDFSKQGTHYVVSFEELKQNK